MTSSGVTSGGSQSHSKGVKGGREEAFLPSVDKERGTDSLPLDSGQTLSPIIKHSITTRNRTSSRLEGQTVIFPIPHHHKTSVVC